MSDNLDGRLKGLRQMPQYRDNSEMQALLTDCQVELARAELELRHTIEMAQAENDALRATIERQNDTILKLRASLED